MKRRPSGFTLVEVLVSMTVLTIGVLGSAQLIGYAINRTAEARKISTAQHLAGEILERLRLEVRFDGEGTLAAGATNSGLAAGASLTADAAWKNDRLPYRSADAVSGSGGGLVTGCNPTGADDGVAYGVGPLAWRYEGNIYWVCYSLTTPMAGYPPNSVGAQVKVLWPAGASVHARHTAGVLVSG